jgi:nucleoside-diphosphate-sugar epimerase
MLRDEKILLTGPAGQIAFPIAEALARENEVWGVSRFDDPAARERVEAAGVTTVACDLGSGAFDAIPTDCTYLLHLAAYQGPSLDYDEAIRVNAEATGLIMQHCRDVKAALVMSTSSVYRPHDDPFHAFVETDPLGETSTPWAPTYNVSKLAQEGVARFAARAFRIPTIIARMNASYGSNGGLPAYHLDAVRAGRPVVTRWEPCPYSPIFQDDINEQVEPLLAAAAVPAPIVNWCGDEVVSVQEWTAYLGELTGLPTEVVVDEQPGSHRGMVCDPTIRASLTGPCRVGWREGMRRMVETRPPA